MLITNIFSFSHNVFYHSQNFNFFVLFTLLPVNAFSLDNPKNLLFGKKFTLYSIGNHFDASATNSF